MIIRACLFAVMASPALADCPTSADLATGIKATLSDGTIEEYRAFRPGLVEIISRLEDGVTTRTLLGQGIYVIELADLENGQIVPDTRITASYPMNADAMPLPEPDGKWSVAVGMRDAGGFFQEKQSHRWGELTQATYQGCTYTMLPGQLVYTGDGYRYDEEIHYLPELGISLLISFSEDGAVPDKYSYNAFEIMGK
ncbi:MAG: hypothetical protein AAFQ09_03450 [Pseudomonadota bacterium]